MDFLPIKQTSTNKVNSAINLANDGGSKSNTGYFNQGGAEENPSDNGDEVTFSHSNSSEEEQVDFSKTDLLKIIKIFLNKIKKIILSLFKNKKENNIYK